MNYAKYDKQKALRQIYTLLETMYGNNDIMSGYTVDGHRYLYRVWHGMRISFDTSSQRYAVYIEHSADNYILLRTPLLIDLLLKYVRESYLQYNATHS